MEENLPLLRDIHLPPQEWIFPLGYGWFLLLLLIIGGYLLYRLGHYMRVKSRKFYALGLIKDCSEDSVNCASKISEILRRICLYKYKHAASLFGKDWIDFLNKHSAKQISGKPAELLIYAPYMSKNEKFTTEDYILLREFAAAWIGANL